MRMSEAAPSPAARTAEELAVLPDDGYRHELVGGELRRMAPAGFRHGAVAVRLAVLLDEFVRPRGLGTVVGAETGFVLERDPDTVLVPDAAFVAADRVPADQRPFAALAPDLVVEIVPPSDRARRVAEKAVLWLEAGSRLVWVVDPERQTISVHRPGAEATTLTAPDDLEGGDVLPGLRAPVADLFA
jgi:Uma2 family endonuclease